MSHVRQQIREALVTTLTGLASTGSRVSGRRVYSEAATALPSLTVMVDDEDVTVLGVSRPSVLDRALNVRIEARAAATADLDDALDTIAAEVETAIGASESAETCGGLLQGPMTLSSVTVEMIAAEQPVGLMTISYIAPYATAAGAPSVAL